MKYKRKYKQDVCTSSHPVVSQGPTTPHVSPCHKVFLSYNSYIRKRTRKIRILPNSWLLQNNLLKQDGPISGDGGDCQEDFLCCRWQGLPNLHPCPPNTSHSKTTSHPNSTQLKSTPSKTSPHHHNFFPSNTTAAFANIWIIWLNICRQFLRWGELPLQSGKCIFGAFWNLHQCRHLLCEGIRYQKWQDTNVKCDKSIINDQISSNLLKSAQLSSAGRTFAFNQIKSKWMTFANVIMFSKAICPMFHTLQFSSGFAAWENNGRPHLRRWPRLLELILWPCFASFTPTNTNTNTNENTTTNTNTIFGLSTAVPNLSFDSVLQVSHR